MVKFSFKYIAFATVLVLSALCFHIKNNAYSGEDALLHDGETAQIQSKAVRPVLYQEPSQESLSNTESVKPTSDFLPVIKELPPIQNNQKPIERTIRQLPTFPDSEETSIAIQALTPEEMATLKSLPPACLSDIPGLEFDPSVAAHESAANNGQANQFKKQPPIPNATIPNATIPNAMNPGGGFQAVPNQANQYEPARSEPVKSQSAQWQQNQTFNPDVLQKMERSVQRIVNADHVVDPDDGSFVQQASANLGNGSIPSPHAMPNPHASTSKKSKDAESDSDADKDSDTDPHLEIYSRTPFPSAKDCAACHEQIYEEWASSSHAYASISPMFHVFEEKINKLTSGTIGYFCLRCHAPVATTMGLRRDQAIWDGPRVFREGVTCVACHRVKTPFSKVDGERRIEPGPVSDPVYGGAASDGSGVQQVGKYKEYFKIKTHESEKGPGQVMHRRAIQFDELSESTFCMSCHQVAVKPGIKLEVVWDQYRASPACREGVSCQDCHMGIVPGRDEGYSVGPAAVVNDKVINPERKHSNHTFYGPGYSIAHPGVFPDNLEADRWTVNQWLEFDWRAGWGTEEYENALADGKFYNHFPQVWQNADDRMDAREIVDENLEKLEYKRDLRRQILENGSKLDGPFFLEPDQRVGQRLAFRYCLTNTNPGHNMPSGSLGAQPQIWMNAVLVGPGGNRLWESGYVDSNGDLADNHSLDVLARRIPVDTQLMNLQTKFLTTNVKGTDREMYLPVNFDVDQLPFIRPDARPVTVLNHPGFIRMEGHSIPPLGSRNVKYEVPARLMTQPGTYQLSVRMRSRAEPIYFMRFCNATPEMQRMMNEWICDFHVSTVVFEVQ
jgi:hypothetical protein